MPGLLGCAVAPTAQSLHACRDSAQKHVLSSFPDRDTGLHPFTIVKLVNINLLASLSLGMWHVNIQSPRGAHVRAQLSMALSEREQLGQLTEQFLYCLRHLQTWYQSAELAQRTGDEDHLTHVWNRFLTVRDAIDFELLHAPEAQPAAEAQVGPETRDVEVQTGQRSATQAEQPESRAAGRRRRRRARGIVQDSRRRRLTSPEP